MNLGIVTIGQTPRDDVVPHLRRFLPPRTRIVQRGVLDGMTRDEIGALGPGPADYVLVTRLSGGTQVRLGRDRVEPLMSRLVARAWEETGLVLVLCTGDLTPPPGVRAVLPGALAAATARLWVETGFTHVGVITPSPDQASAAGPRWQARLGPGARPVRVASASPYSTADELAAKARDLDGVDMVIMDCMGFSPRMKAAVTGALGVPVILPVTLAGRLLGEIMDSGA